MAKLAINQNDCRIPKLAIQYFKLAREFSKNAHLKLPCNDDIHNQKNKGRNQ
jgi:hypothetical protein